ncbi:MAG: amidohydrolase family protein [Gammaproteobacteria bacterium]|nr:amidohydrolase family protein [Gammaproteobacteria bacterium]
MSHDLVIKNGIVVDGSGEAGFRADVAISDGLITEVGKISGSARETVDADGLVVSPGFIDNHTHYDAQICWDPMLTPSSWHGVTTAILGNCGLGMAPVTAAGRAIATEDLVSIEGMPVDALKAGIDWNWESFPEYMRACEARNPAINLGFLAPLTPFRHYVVGEESIERASTPEEIATICGLLRESMEAGALGFSTSKLPLDIGYKAQPVASRLAPPEELAAYAGVLKSMDKGVIQLSLLSEVGKMTDEEYSLIDTLLDAGGRKVTWLALLSREDRPEAGMAILDKCNDQYRRGSVPAVAVRPMIIALQLKGNPLVMGELATMQQAFNLDLPEQIKVYSDPAFRAALRADMAKPGLIPWNWSRIEVGRVSNPALKSLEGRSIADIAAERGADPVDAFLDVAVEDRLEVSYNMPLFNTNDALCSELFNDPRTIVSLSDGGAHADMLCDAGFSTYMLGYWAREQQVISMENAVKRLTADQADFYGLKDRGRVQAGKAADIVLFDPLTVGSPLKPEMVHDFPGGCSRLITRPTGVARVIVNGKSILVDSEETGLMPGRMVRN